MRHFIFSIILSVFCCLTHGAVDNGLVNSVVARSVDLSSHLPKIVTSITLENTGSSAVKSFIYAVENAQKEHLSFIAAMAKDGEDETPLTVTETKIEAAESGKFFSIHLGQALAAGKKTSVEVETAFSHALRAYPSQIAQAEKQFMEFSSSLYYFSPYKTTSQTTIVTCASTNVESYTKTNPVKVADNVITYGPFNDVEAFSSAPLVIHFENNTPFLTVSHLTRVIEVSHWGNVAIEETVEIRHSGAVLKGSFSRYDYQRQQDGYSSVKSFKTILPAAARDVYYRDAIGNISTSNLRELEDMVEVELRPRFPLFGGWKTHYLLGYNVPSYQYLYNRDNDYVLKMRFVDHIYDDQVIDEMTLKIILPEGAKDLDFKAPFPVTRDADNLHFTYLDTLGRPVVTAHKTNMVEQHIQDFELSYKFDKLRLLQEPLLVVTAFYLLFLVVIIYVRLDFSITKDEASESRMRVASLLEQVQGIQDRRSALYQSYDDTIEKFKSTKDNTTFIANRKKIDGDYKLLTQQIGGLLSKLKAEGSETSDKVAELQKLDDRMKEQIGMNINSAEKLIAGKMNKAQYVEYEGNVNSKREDLYQKMENLLGSL